MDEIQLIIFDRYDVQCSLKQATRNRKQRAHICILFVYLFVYEPTTDSYFMYVCML